MKKAILAVACTSVFSVQAKMNTNFYGYIEGYLEQVEPQQQWEGGTASSQGEVKKKDNPHEFQTPNVTAMVKSTKGKFSSFLNLSAASGEVETRNAWVEMRKSDKLKFRIGKLYRPFGLYNERLDAVPTYIGIEAPELYDSDHLLLTRTTNFMMHGDFYVNGNTLRYAITTGNDERLGGEVPIGADLRYTKITDAGNTFLVGASFYTSGGAAVRTDSNVGGVASWMERDEYTVSGLYTEYLTPKHTFQAAYYQSSHSAVRNLSTINGWDPSSLNDGQRERICGGANWGSCTEADVDYDIVTWYVRYGYTFESNDWGMITPYVQWDYYKNPEMIANKDLGGDNEAGLADDGAFNKQTLGIFFRPENELAIKVDASNHQQEMDGKTVNYAEIRSSFSYIWAL